MTFFRSEMTSEELEDWMDNIQPIMVRWEDQARERARQSALEMIRRPYLSREELYGDAEEATDG